MDFDEFVRKSLKKAADTLPEFKQVSSNKTKLNGLLAQRVVFRCKWKTTYVRALMYIVFADGRAYHITCTATTDEYPRHESIFEDVCKTFETFGTLDEDKAG